MTQPSDRTRWWRTRLSLEERIRWHARRTTLDGERFLSHAFNRIFQNTIRLSLQLCGLWWRGKRNAMDVRVKHHTLAFDSLPESFDGFRILHLSDLHVGAYPAVIQRWCEAVAETPCDLAVITGDFQCQGHPSANITARMLAPLLSAFSATDGIIAVLGNHDSADLPAALERTGVRVLVNEALTLSRKDKNIRVVGTDDVHCFFTPAAPQSLMTHAGGFAIALVHTIDLVDVAEAAGYALYLSGHTHGGQITFPNGKPILTGLDRHQHLASGIWTHGNMVGHTSPGTGSGSPFVRFNTRPEATLIQLVRA